MNPWLAIGIATGIALIAVAVIAFLAFIGGFEDEGDDDNFYGGLR